MSGAAFGILLLVLAGAMNGSFTLPMKFTRKWAWENTWLVWSIFALVIFPPLAALATIPKLGDVYSQAGAGPIVIAAACGAGWGVAQVFFGLGVEAVGIALTFSIVLGISASVGSLVPMCLDGNPAPFSSKGMAVLGGVALVIAGVLICAKAGRAREAALGQGPKGSSSMGKGLLFCTLSGLGAALVALGLQYGGSLARIAQEHGADPLWSNNATWLPLMLGGAIPNLAYCLYLMSKNGTGNRFSARGTGSYWILAAVMALFWFGSTVMYGVASNSLGIVVAWPAFMSLIVITAMIWGVVTGEWKDSGSRPLRVMYSGLAVLVLSIVVLSLTKS
jgi:L-rhamnose-H+ transport protein